ncbi:MAG: hypothetical protein CM1200mP30_06310 [Pseudomonadota bacterium]|nr:MAG: hypothetical protein CM1200mP30_06310 [Pseudomonadota bacterium]
MAIGGADMPCCFHAEQLFGMGAAAAGFMLSNNFLSLRERLLEAAELFSVI